MRNKEQKGDLSVQAIAGTHVVLLGMDLPEQDCPGLLGFALRREDRTEGEKYWLSGYSHRRRQAFFTRRGSILFKVSRGRIFPRNRSTITRMKCLL